VLVLAPPVLAAPGAQVLRVGEVDEGGEAGVDGEHDVTAVAPVAAVRAAARHVLLAPEADAAPAAVARRDADPHLVDELHVARMVAEGGAPLHAGRGLVAVPVGSPTREAGHGEPQTVCRIAQVAVGSDEDDVGPRDAFGRREVHGVVAAEVVVMREHAGSRRERGRHADPIDLRPEAFEFGNCELQLGVRQPPLAAGLLEPGRDGPAVVAPDPLRLARASDLGRCVESAICRRGVTSEASKVL